MRRRASRVLSACCFLPLCRCGRDCPNVQVPKVYAWIRLDDHALRCIRVKSRAPVDLLEGLATTRSIRRYTDDPVDSRRPPVDPVARRSSTVGFESSAVPVPRVARRPGRRRGEVAARRRHSAPAGTPNGKPTATARAASPTRCSATSIASNRFRSCPRLPRPVPRPEPDGRRIGLSGLSEPAARSTGATDTAERSRCGTSASKTNSASCSTIPDHVGALGVHHARRSGGQPRPAATQAARATSSSTIGGATQRRGPRTPTRDRRSSFAAMPSSPASTPAPRAPRSRFATSTSGEVVAAGRGAAPGRHPAVQRTGSTAPGGRIRDGLGRQSGAPTVDGDRRRWPTARHGGARRRRSARPPGQALERHRIGRRRRVADRPARARRRRGPSAIGSVPVAAFTITKLSWLHRTAPERVGVAWPGCCSRTTT